MFFVSVGKLVTFSERVASLWVNSIDPRNFDLSCHSGQGFQRAVRWFQPCYLFSLRPLCGLRDVAFFSRSLCKKRDHMSKRWMRLTAGDRVKMEMSPYDLNKGRITWRLR